MSLSFSVKEIKKILVKNDFKMKLPEYEDKKLWQIIGERDFTENILKNADSVLNKPIPDVRFSSYKEFEKSGDRKAHENAANEKKSNLRNLVIAENIERSGKYLDCINDYIWSFCEETAWVMSAHLSYYNVEVPFKNYDYIDLGVVSRAELLAEVAYIMDDLLAEEVKERLSEEIEQRVFTPFLRYNDFWWMSGRNNWNSVCHAGVINTAILQDISNDRLARMLKKTMNNITTYMQSFDEDGCTSEGVGYWNYGFGNYVEMADLVHRRTGGQINFFELDDKIEKIVEFPLKVELSPGKFPNFADSSQQVSFSPYLIHTLVDYFDKPKLYSLLKPEDYNSQSFKDLAIRDIKAGSTFEKKKRIYFQGFQWLVSRVRANDEDSLVLAVKGGNNAEDHNHNDCGSFIIHLDGESFILDLGKPPYTKITFSGERYSLLACRSKGHNVPLVNGCEQKKGVEFKAKLLGKKFGDTEDKIVFELKDLYPEEAGLEFLIREVIINKENEGFVRLRDEFKFKDNSQGKVVEHFYSYNQPLNSDKYLIIKGKKRSLKIVPEGKIEIKKKLIKNAVGNRNVYQLKFIRENIEHGVVAVNFIPV